MARRLTERERENVETLTSQLIEALPPAQRSFSSGIASALVRMSGDTVTEDDLTHILEKYEEADETVAQVVRDTLLDAVEGQEGVYTLRLPEAAGEGEAPADAAEADSGASDASATEDAPEREAGTDGETKAEAVAAAPAEEDAGARHEDAPTGEAAAEDPQDPEGGEPEGAGASDEPAPAAEDAPAPKARRSHRRTRHTHKTAKDSQRDSQAQASSAEGAPAEAASDDPQAGREPAGRVPSDKPSPDKASPEKTPPDKAPAGKAPTGRGDSGKPDRGHRKDSSRDLKKVPYVRRGGDTEAETRQKILNLDQRFWLNGWLLSHPAAYTLYERELLAINDALKDGMLPGDITRRQLAYQMGGDEKFFEYGSDGFRLLRAMGMEDVIRHRPMPKPDLVYYAPRRRKHMTVLVTENLDPYLDVHDLMYEDGRTSILGQRIHAVVLGGGTPILEKNRLALLLDTLGADTVTVLYWGDIDRAGLEIMVKLKEVLGDGYRFRAFTPAYQLMVDKASERFPDPADNESTGQVNIEPMDASLLVDGLTDEAAAYARAVIDDCGLIPQEILTRRDL